MGEQGYDMKKRKDRQRRGSPARWFLESGDLSEGKGHQYAHQGLPTVQGAATAFWSGCGLKKIPAGDWLLPESSRTGLTPFYSMRPNPGQPTAARTKKDPLPYSSAACKGWSNSSLSLLNPTLV